MKKLLVLLLAGLTTGYTSCKSITEKKYNEQSGILVFDAGENFDHTGINIHYYLPAGDPSKMEVQIVLHGMDRNAHDYLVPWAAKAREYGLVTIAPEFQSDYFDTEMYNEGNTVNSNGDLNPAEKTTFFLIDRIFEFVNEELDLNAESYNIFGHSAGAQFVHRFILFYDSPYLGKAVAANAGWYTFPDGNIVYPYGVEALTGDINSFRANCYGKQLTILLGTADTLRTSSLRTTAQADAQGLNRFERGNNFFDTNRQWAVGGGDQFSWQLRYVEDAGHDHTLMSPAAADHLYGGNR